MHYGSLINKDKYDSLGPAERALYKYTADGFTFISPQDFKSLAKKYPYEGGTLYRGLHFDTQEQHDKFMESIKDGALHVNGMSSWTPSESTAKDFARTKKSFWPTPELMKAERERSNAGDFMTGYGGVVMKLELKPGVGIDVNKSEFARESEVLVPEGVYQVRVHELTVPYRRKYDTPEKAKALVKVLSEKPDKTALASFLRSSWLKELSPAEVDKLIEHFSERIFQMSPKEFGEKAVVAKFEKFMREIFSIDVYVPFEHQLYVRASPRMKKLIDKYISEAKKALATRIKEMTSDERFLECEEFRVHGIKELSEFVDLDEVVRPLRRALASLYHHLNSREMNKQINQSNMSDHARKIGEIVQAIASLGK